MDSDYFQQLAVSRECIMDLEQEVDKLEKALKRVIEGYEKQSYYGTMAPAIRDAKAVLRREGEGC